MEIGAPNTPLPDFVLLPTKTVQGADLIFFLNNRCDKCIIMHYVKETALESRTWEKHFLDGSPWVGLWWDGSFEEVKSFVTPMETTWVFTRYNLLHHKELNVAGESKEFMLV